MKANDPYSFSDRSEKSACSSGSKQQRNKGKKVFTEKLMEVLSLEETSHAITWLPNGKVFEVVNRTKLVEDVLPRFFQQTRFDSFDRKLRRWGFKRVIRGSSALLFHHPMFRRDEPVRCKTMRSTYMESLGNSATDPQTAKSDTASFVSRGRRRSSATISVGVSELELDSEESEEGEGKPTASCLEKKTPPFTEENITEEQDQIISNLKTPATLEHQRLLYIPNQSRIAQMEAHSAALRKETLEYFHNQVSFDCNLPAQNNAYPSLLQDSMQTCDAVSLFSSTHLPNEVTLF